MHFKHTKSWAFALACVLLVSSGVFGQRAFLVIDRTTGAAEAVSSVDIPVDGYDITSASGLLSVEGWNSLADQGVVGWTESNPVSTRLTELSLTNGGLQAGVPVAIGSPYTAGVVSNPNDEDVQWQFAVPNSDPTVAGEVVDGFVRYTGASPLPAISVDRGSGKVELTNPGGFDVSGFSIASSSGLLDAAGLQLPTGFTDANSKDTLVSGLNFTGSVAFPSTQNLGNIFSPGGVVPLTAEDLTLEYTIPGSVDVFPGIVNYTGAVNDLVLKIDELTGAASIEHMSPNVGSVEITSYSILSASDGLDTNAWTKVGGDFSEAGARAGAIAELSLGATMTFSNGTSHDLGTIFSGNSQDLIFQYATPDVDEAIGSVQYVFGAGSTGPTCDEIAASRTLGGDLDGNDKVDFADFLVLSGNFGLSNVGYEGGDVDCSTDVGFADFLVLSGNFGKEVGGAASVPEPTSITLAMLSMLCGLAFRKRR